LEKKKAASIYYFLSKYFSERSFYKKNKNCPKKRLTRFSDSPIAK